METKKIIINIYLNQIKIMQANNDYTLPIGTDFDSRVFRSDDENKQVIKNRLVSDSYISADDINNYEVEII